MRSLNETGSDAASSRGMDPTAFFKVMGLNTVIDLDKQAGGEALEQLSD